MRIEIRVWSENLDVTSLEEVPPGVQLAEDRLLTGDPANDAFWMYLWQLRRELWNELISSGQLEVTFTHNGEEGSGSGPNLQFAGQDGSRSGISLVTLDFSDTDILYGEYSGAPGVFGWSEFELENIAFEDLGDEDDDEALYEYTFSSKDRLAVVHGVEVPGPRWHELKDSAQAQVVQLLQGEVARQQGEWNEVMLDVLDVLCAIAAHPGTVPSVTAMALAADLRCASVLGTAD